MEKYVYNRESLPCPVFPAKPEWVELYYRAWELAFQNVEYIEQEGWKPMNKIKSGWRMPGNGSGRPAIR